jgi:hypothetical protein
MQYDENLSGMYIVSPLQSGLESVSSVASDLIMFGTDFVVAAGVTSTLIYDHINRMKRTLKKAKYSAPLDLWDGSP